MTGRVFTEYYYDLGNAWLVIDENAVHREGVVALQVLFLTSLRRPLVPSGYRLWSTVLVHSIRPSPQKTDQLSRHRLQLRFGCITGTPNTSRQRVTMAPESSYSGWPLLQKKTKKTPEQYPPGLVLPYYLFIYSLPLSPSFLLTVYIVPPKPPVVDHVIEKRPVYTYEAEGARVVI